MKTRSEVPQLPGWVGITEASEKLGISRQHGYRLLTQKFGSIHRIGQEILVVSEKELNEQIKVREAKAAEDLED